MRTSLIVSGIVIFLFTLPAIISIGSIITYATENTFDALSVFSISSILLIIICSLVIACGVVIVESFVNVIRRNQKAEVKTKRIRSFLIPIGLLILLTGIHSWWQTPSDVFTMFTVIKVLMFLASGTCFLLYASMVRKFFSPMKLVADK